MLAEMLRKALSSGAKVTKGGSKVFFHDASPSFVPYACHYSEDTVLTKNGELLKTIKIKDFHYDTNERSERDLRTLVRDAILEHANLSFSFYIHTTRTHYSINQNLQIHTSSGFSKGLHDEYVQQNIPKTGFINELYISIIISGMNEKFSFIPQPFYLIKKRHLNYLQNAHQSLNETVERIMSNLSPFSPELLKIQEKDGQLFSENMSFFHFLMTFEQKDIPLPLEDISECLTKDMKSAVGYNTLEILQEDTGRKTFCTVLALKQNNIVSLDGIDKVIQLPLPLIISEFFHFNPKKKLDAELQKQHYYFSVGYNEEFSKQINLDDIVEYPDSYNKFCSKITTVTVQGSFFDELHDNSVIVRDALSSIGILSIKADILLENLFWGRLPGNFSMNIKTTNVFNQLTCTFANLHNYTSGSMQNSYWNECITFFMSANNNYYFFNFHQNDNGHTAIIGPEGSGRTMLCNFLISESMKLNIKLLHLDSTNKSEIFVNSLGKKYVHIYKSGSTNTPRVKLNPLLIDDTEENRQLLLTLFKKMRGDLTPREESAGTTMDDIEPKINALIDKIFTLPKEERYLSNLSEKLDKLGGIIKKWYGDGVFAPIFDNKDGIEWDKSVEGINTKYVIENPFAISATIYYVLHQFEKNLDGSPTILVLEECWKIVSAFSTQAYLEEWVIKMREKNVVVIFLIDDKAVKISGKFITYINKIIATQMFLPLHFFAQRYKEFFNLTSEQLSAVTNIPGQSRFFFVKQNNRHTILKFEIRDRKKIRVLSSDNIEIVNSMYDAKNANGDKIDEWLKGFYEKIG